MKSQDAKFILRAYRSDGRYRTDDPLFADALAEVERDGALAIWLDREQRLDAAVANKLDGIAPPADLRDAILVGARASRLARPWWHRPSAWLAAAAILTIAALLPTLLRSRAPGAMDVTRFAEYSLAQLAQGLHQHDSTPAITALATSLAKTPTPFPAGLKIDAARMHRTGCQSFTFAGHEVFEVCFEREGVWYHLYVTSGGNNTRGSGSREPVVVQKGGSAIAAWSADGHMFALATRHGAAALQSLL